MTTLERVSFDTVSIIAAIIADHPNHARAVIWLQKAQRKEIVGLISAHSIAETYNVLTGGLKVKPVLALQLLEQSVLSTLEVVPLTEADYLALVKHLVGLNISGGKIYDGLIAYAAWKAGTDYLLIYNKKHFDAIYPTHTAQIIEP